MTPDEKRNARKERLSARLADAEGKLDGAMFKAEPGSMRGQQRIAGLRGQVLGLRAELCQIAMAGPTAGSEAWEAQRANRDALLVRVEKSELASRAASRQATEDDIPDMMARLDAVDHRAERARSLH